MEKLITELKNLVPFKDSCDVGDIVIIAAKEPQMVVYALVRSIERDESRKDEWWKVEMTLLSVPPQEIQWTLRTPQLTGMEIFTMGGNERFVKAVEFSGKETQAIPEKITTTEKRKGFIKRVK